MWTAGWGCGKRETRGGVLQGGLVNESLLQKSFRNRDGGTSRPFLQRRI